jgi:hypothetical protein
MTGRPFGIPSDGWLDATGWGSEYQQQRNVDTGAVRHRKWKLIGDGAVKRCAPDDAAPWIDGPAPRSALSPETVHEFMLSEMARRE